MRDTEGALARWRKAERALSAQDDRSPEQVEAQVERDHSRALYDLAGAEAPVGHGMPTFQAVHDARAARDRAEMTRHAAQRARSTARAFRRSANGTETPLTDDREPNDAG